VIKVLFDTSVLVASILVNHEQHSACISWLIRVKRGEIQGYIGTHTLAELYAILKSGSRSFINFESQAFYPFWRENRENFYGTAIT